MPLPQAATDGVSALVAAVRADAEASARQPRSEVRWVRLDGLHLTIRFIGPVAEEHVSEFAALVDRCARRTPGIPIELAGAGAVPSPARPRTIWLAVGAGADSLAALAGMVDSELEALGVPGQRRPFRAHLTLARADGRREGPLVAARLAARADGMTIPFVADRLVLFESITGGGPARYVARHEARLAG